MLAWSFFLFAPVLSWRRCARPLPRSCWPRAPFVPALSLRLALVDGRDGGLRRRDAWRLALLVRRAVLASGMGRLAGSAEGVGVLCLPWAAHIGSHRVGSVGGVRARFPSCLGSFLFSRACYDFTGGHDFIGLCVARVAIGSGSIPYCPTPRPIRQDGRGDAAGVPTAVIVLIGSSSAWGSDLALLVPSSVSAGGACDVVLGANGWAGGGGSLAWWGRHSYSLPSPTASPHPVVMSFSFSFFFFRPTPSCVFSLACGPHINPPPPGRGMCERVIDLRLWAGWRFACFSSVSCRSLRLRSFAFVLPAVRVFFSFLVFLPACLAGSRCLLSGPVLASPPCSPPRVPRPVFPVP